jgi:SAM-dependent methyltransferase
MHGAPLAEEGGRLRCPSGDAYPVVDAIPRFVRGARATDAFGIQWNRYRLTQLDSHTGTTISRDRLRHALGEELWAGLRDRVVLEVGCGAGRFTEILLEHGARVVSVDLSEAVAANVRNFPISSHHRVAQADLHGLPFEPRQFDLVLCLGVVQHTESPERAIGALYEQAGPGGTLVFDHYTYGLSSLGFFLSTSPLVRAYFRRLPPDEGLRYTEALVRRLWPLHSHGRRYRTLLNRVSPVVTYFGVLDELSDEQQREWALLDTHDSLTDWFKRFRTRGSLERTLAQLGAADVVCTKAGNGVEARARRPD